MIWPFARNPVRPAPLTVNHVRYVSKPCIDPLDKALAMARQMNRDDLVGRIEEARAGR
jgi:hypothetical protein